MGDCEEPGPLQTLPLFLFVDKLADTMAFFMATEKQQQHPTSTLSPAIMANPMRPSPSALKSSPVDHAEQDSRPLSGSWAQHDFSLKSIPSKSVLAQISFGKSLCGMSVKFVRNKRKAWTAYLTNGHSSGIMLVTDELLPQVLHMASAPPPINLSSSNAHSPSSIVGHVAVERAMKRLSMVELEASSPRMRSSASKGWSIPTTPKNKCGVTLRSYTGASQID